MKTNNSIYIFFIALSLVFWNPLSYFLFYRNTPVYAMKAVPVFYWFVFTGSFVLMYLIQKNKLSERTKNILLSISLTGIFLAIPITTNKLMGYFSKNHISTGLIFEPNTSAHYQTVEYNYIATINSIGLRDKEVSINKGNKFRILCFGDSWTFGWGVSIENSWPKKLEQYLGENTNKNIEVINCGKGGEYTTTYKQYMEKAVPLLKPDLVLVGVLQLDDLAQLYENNFKEKTSSNPKAISNFSKIKFVFKTYLQYSFNNLIALFTKKKPTEIQSEWKEQVSAKIEGYNHLQSIRFCSLNDSLQSLFKTGNLNPGLLEYYIDFTDRPIIFNNPNLSATQFAVREMNKDIVGMKKICTENKCNLVFVNLPYNEFTGHKVIRTPTDELMNQYLENNNKIDSIYNSVALVNKLPYIELTGYFKSLENKSQYFFLYDGHPTEKGYQEIANYIGKQLIDQNLLK